MLNAIPKMNQCLGMLGLSHWKNRLYYKLQCIVPFAIITVLLRVLHPFVYDISEGCGVYCVLWQRTSVYTLAALFAIHLAIVATAFSFSG